MFGETGFDAIFFGFGEELINVFFRGVIQEDMEAVFGEQQGHSSTCISVLVDRSLVKVDIGSVRYNIPMLPHPIIASWEAHPSISFLSCKMKSNQCFRIRLQYHTFFISGTSAIFST